jgi:hypothetical protein
MFFIIRFFFLNTLGAFGHVSKVIHKATKMVRAMKVLKKTSLIKEEE